MSSGCILLITTVVPSTNSLVIAGKIPGAWLVQIKDAGHALFAQYPDKVNKVLQTIQVDRILTDLVCFCNLSYYKVFALKSIKWFMTEEDDGIGSRMNDKQ
jgi:hypothetical protein